MSCITKPVFKPLPMANGCLISLPAIFSSKTSYPYLSIPSKPIKLHLSCSFSSSLPSSLSLNKTTHSSSIVAFVAQTSDWDQQGKDTTIVAEEEFSWGNPEVGDTDEEGAVEVVGDAGESGGEEGFVEGEGDESYPELSEDAKIFVGNLHYEVDSEKLAQLFEQAGVVEIAEVIYNRETDQSRGFGFVTMSTVEEAEKAVEMFHRYDLNGRLLTVNKAAPRGTRPERPPRVFEPTNRIYVGNLPWDVDSSRLEQLFSEHGKVVDARVVSDRETGRSRGFGFVTMSTEAELNDAIANLDGKLSCKCSSGADAHATTMVILNMLSNYSWDAKVVISLAAFAVNYGEFWLVTQLVTSNQLAKSVALLKQLPDIIEHASTLKSRFHDIKNLIKALLDVTKCIVEFKELPSQYVSPDTPPMSTALTHIPTATYWTIRSMVACASQITSLLGMRHEHIASTTEAWELSSLAHKISNIDGHLKNQLRICHHHIDEKRHAETFQMLIRLLEMSHVDNVRILKALIYSKDDQLPLVEGTTKKRASIEVLKRKTVLLLISDLDICHEEIMYLSLLHQDTRTRTDLHYEIVWLPIMDRSTKPMNDANQQKFEQLQSMMPWYTLHPLLLEPAVIRYIKEFWHFDKKLILVVLDQQGRVACPNAHHMVWIWGNLAYPFTTMREELLWKEETWRLELLADAIDENIINWITQEKYICLYGGEDIEWIRKFSAIAKAVAGAAGIVLEMVYVGKSSPNERVRKLNAIINAEKLSHCWPDLMSIWFFWERLESMLYSKMQHGKIIEDDLIMEGVLSVLSFNGSDQGWAIMSKGSGEMARAMGDLFLTCLATFDTWKDNAKGIGFMAALNQKLQELHTPQHCNRIILPGINGGIPEKVICAECGRPMEKYYMYRCCTD